MKAYTIAWLALLALTTVSWVSAASTGMALGLGIGAVKALVIAAVFMHLSESRATPRLALGVAVSFVLIFAGIMALDPLTR
jgi:caa(3)-type oxidase subunit IV